MSEQIALVDYLVLGDDPHLVVQECLVCGARYFDRRNACAGCSGTEFSSVRVASEGVVRAFTIVALIVSSWCGLSLWRWQRDGPAKPSDSGSSPSDVTRHVPLRGALSDVPGRRHQGRRFASRQRGRGCTSATQVPVVRPSLHDVRTH